MASLFDTRGCLKIVFPFQLLVHCRKNKHDKQKTWGGRKVANTCIYIKKYIVDQLELRQYTNVTTSVKQVQQQEPPQPQPAPEKNFKWPSTSRHTSEVEVWMESSSAGGRFKYKYMLKGRDYTFFNQWLVDSANGWLIQPMVGWFSHWLVDSANGWLIP